MASTPMRMTRHKSKAQVESPMGDANRQLQIQEEPAQQPTGEGAVVEAVSGADAAVEITVQIAKTRLHCPVCTLPLKPPIFQCVVGHLACGAHPRLISSGRCYECGHGGGFARSRAVEGIVRSAMVPCPHDVYGCRTYVTYYDAAEHQRACLHAPCLCSEPGCGFAGPPPALRDHLAGAYSCPVDWIQYGAELELCLPQSDHAKHRRLLAAGDDDFFLAVGALGDTPLGVVSLMCAHGSAAAAAGPRYSCTIRVWHAAQSVVLETPVPSSAAPAETSMEEAASLVVLRRVLHAAVPGEMRFSIRIDRID